MDEQLAAIYGTGQEVHEEDDLEKTAAAELLVKLAAEEGLDLDTFSDEEVGEMINELQGGVEHTAEAEAEGQEKFAEADFLGRVMAHSMVQELDSIEKDAGKVWEGAKGGVKAVGKFLKRRVSKPGERYRAAGEGVKGMVTGKGWEGGKAATEGVSKLERLRAGGRALRQVSPELVGAGALGAGGYAALRKGKEKKGSDDSAIEQLAEQRAFDMAKEAGFINDEGQFLVEMPEQQKEASALDHAVEQRALQICEANGLPVEWDK